MIDATSRVHPTADLEDGVVVGPRSSVWHRAQLRSGARIGADCVLGRDVFIDIGVVLGDRVKVQNAALLYHGVVVGSGVFIGPNAILTNDRYPRAETGDGSLAREADWEVSPIHVGDGASIGAGAVIVAGVEIGRFAMVGAGAVVTRDVPDHALVAGNPARSMGWACVCGRRLADMAGSPATAELHGPAACTACGRRFLVDHGRCLPLPGAAARA